MSPEMIKCHICGRTLYATGGDGVDPASVAGAYLERNDGSRYEVIEYVIPSGALRLCDQCGADWIEDEPE